MQRKLKSKYNNELPPRYSNCFASLDGKRYAIARPSGPNNQQAGAYNAYYGYHNLAFQTITAPDGMFLHFGGPYAGAATDLNMLVESRAVQDLRDALIATGAVDQVMDVVCDKIYNIAAAGVAALRRRHNGNVEVLEDAAACFIRIPVEWSQGNVINLFSFLDFEKNLKINEREIGKYICVGALLTNLHTCLYGSQTSSYFSIEIENVFPPTLEEYMEM
jgi:hypothetical protein